MAAEKTNFSIVRMVRLLDVSRSGYYAWRVRKTAAATMRRLGLAGISPRKWKTTTVIDHADAYPVDAVERQWDTGELNRVWVGDITYLRTWEEWIYLATVIDAHSRRVIWWAIADHMRTDLIQDALVMAMALRGDRPAVGSSTAIAEPNTPPPK